MKFKIFLAIMLFVLMVCFVFAETLPSNSSGGGGGGGGSGGAGGGGQGGGCLDTDGGINYYAKGIAAGIWDSCISKYELSERYCTNNAGADVVAECPLGYLCQDGACVQSNEDDRQPPNSTSGGGSGSGGGGVIPNSTSGGGDGGGTVPNTIVPSSGGSGGGGSGVGYIPPISGGTKDRFLYDSTISGVPFSYSIAINSEGKIYLTDEANKKVWIYDNSGNVGSLNQEFSFPSLVYVDKQDNIFVVDSEIVVNEVGDELSWGRVRKFDKNSNLLLKFQGINIQYLEFHPAGMAIDSSGRVYFSIVFFSNPTSGSIFIYNSDGTFYKRYDDERFKYISWMAIDSRDNLFINDRKTHEIYEYDKNLNFVKEITDSENGGFNDIKGMDVDSYDRLFVADTGNERIEVFDSAGNYYATINGNGMGSENTQFSLASDVKLHDSKVYVEDARNKRIQIFSEKPIENSTSGGGGGSEGGQIIPNSTSGGGGGSSGGAAIPNSTSGGGSGGGSGVGVPTCERYYNCSDGSMVQFCFIHELYNENGEAIGAGCGCKSDPASLCISSSSGGASGGGAGQPIPITISGTGGGSAGSNETPIICNGCIIGNKCAPVGYRLPGKYCTINSEFVTQSNAGISCENNFECSTNLCIDNECVSSGIWQRFLRWFKRFF